MIIDAVVQPPLTLSQSKGVGWGLSFDPLKWFDKLTMSGFNPRSENRKPPVSIEETSSIIWLSESRAGLALAGQ